MASPKGYPTQDKDDRLKAENTTIEPVREKQNGMSVLSHSYAREVGTDTAEASSTISVVNATAHAALKGDVIRFTAGTLSGQEVKVHSTTTNAITLAEDLSVAPGLDAFQILRHKYPLVNADGSQVVSATLAAAPLLFTLDGADQEVTEDTVTPANNAPLPVKLTGTTGDINITAGDLNVQTTHIGVNFDSQRIGDGVETVNVNASNEFQVRDDDANTALTSLDTKLPAQGAALTAASTPVNIASDQTVAVSASALPLPTGAATEATLATIDTDTGVIAGDTTSLDAKTPALGTAVIAASVPVNIASDQTVPVSASALPLPTGASTEATLSAMNAKLVSGTDIGDVTINNASGASAVNIQDGGNVISIDDAGGSITVDGTVTALSSAIDVVDFIDTTPVLDTSSTNIPGSAGNPVEIIASLAANVSKLKINDTSGFFFGVYTGAALSEVLQCVVGPGEDGSIDVVMASAERVSLRAMAATAISSGEVCIQFIG
ncbi:hypothetical protein GOV11_04160 [Candidatus Woesearchaeota archaeon]|nr:hypothetical protein [Candidatus Woesearchaeota archaeon]